MLKKSQWKQSFHCEEDLEIDSLGIVEVVMAFEDEFGIEIDDEELTDVGTVGQAVNLLHSKL